jgi:hypothetical protein
MSADPHYVYGQAQDSRSSRRILLGMVIVDIIGYKERRYRPAWGRVALLFPLFITGLWVVTAELYLFNQKYMNGIATTRRADMYLYFPDTLATSFGNLFRSKEAIRLREREKIIHAGEGYGRAAHLRRKGQFYVQIAKAALARQDYAEFAKYIGTGSSLSPTDLEAQRLCADLFFAFNRPLDSYQLLEDAMAFAKQDREHFRTYLQRCFMLDQDQRVITTAAKYLADPEVTPEIKQDLQLAAAQANFLRGNFAEAARIVKSGQLTLTPEGYLLNCQILWESGEREAALELLNLALKTNSTSARLLEIKTTWLKDMGRLGAAQDCLALLSIIEPEKAGPLIQSLYLMPGEANRGRRGDLIDRIIARFGGQEQAMLDLSRYGNESADPGLTLRLRKLAEDRRFPNRVRFTLVHVECLLNANRPRDTIQLVDELYKRAEREQWTTETRIAFEALRMIAYFADGQADIGSINLQKLMQNRNIPPQLLVSASRKLIAARRFDEANEVLIQAHLQNEANQAVLMQIVRLKLEHPRISADLETYLRRLMLNRRPPKEVLQASLRRLGSDAFIFSENRTKLLSDIEALLN